MIEVFLTYLNHNVITLFCLPLPQNSLAESLFLTQPPDTLFISFIAIVYIHKFTSFTVIKN
jgi:hypothetical protein